jgi:hypothetical protein
VIRKVENSFYHSLAFGPAALGHLPAARGTAMVKTRDPTMLPALLLMWPNPRLETPTLKPKPEARNPKPDNRNPTPEPP